AWHAPPDGDWGRAGLAKTMRARAHTVEPRRWRSVLPKRGRHVREIRWHRGPRAGRSARPEVQHGGEPSSEWRKGSIEAWAWWLSSKGGSSREFALPAVR